MSFVIKAKTLAEIVGIASKVCGGRSAMAIAECVRLRFAGEEIMADTTDFDNWITVATDNAEKMKEFETAVIPCKQFHSIISSLPGDQDVSLSATKKQLTVKSGASKYNFGLVPEEWPSFPWDNKGQVIDMDSVDLLDRLKFVQNSIGMDEVRFYLNGVNLKSIGDNSLRFIAATGHCASMTVLPMEKKPVMPKAGVIVPAKLVNFYIELLSKIDGDGCSVRFEVTESKARLQFSSQYKISLMGRLLDGSFPDIDQVIPYQRENVVVVVPRQEMIEDLRRIETFCDQKTRDISLNFYGDKIRIAAKGEHSDAEEIIDIEKQKWKGTVTLNIRLLTNLLLSMESDLATLLIEPSNIGSAAIMFTEGETALTPESKNFSIIMPMKG